MRLDRKVLPWSAMELFTITPADRHFLARSLRCHVVVWLVVGVFFTIGSLVPSQEPYAASLDGKTQVSIGVIAQIDAHVPVGWRRTADGWEHTSNWLSRDKSIDTWIEEQKSREPAWIQRTLEIIRNTPPLMFAILQLSMITVVVLITTRGKMAV